MDDDGRGRKGRMEVDEEVFFPPHPVGAMYSWRDH